VSGFVSLRITVAASLIGLAALAAPGVQAQTTSSIQNSAVGASGLSLPRFVSLKSGRVNRADLVVGIWDLRGGRKVDDPNAEERYQALEKYGIDLTARARKGELDPVIGRDEEIRRVVQVFAVCRGPRTPRRGWPANRTPPP